MKLLEDETNLLRAEAVQRRLRHVGDVGAVNPDFAGGWLVQTANQIHQRGLTRTGWPHHCQPLARGHRQRNVIQRADLGVRGVYPSDVL